MQFPSASPLFPATTVLSVLLAATSLINLGASSPSDRGSLLPRATKDSDCFCTSPTGCPGLCMSNNTGFYCSNYCGNGVVLECASCGNMTGGNFTGNCWFDNAEVCQFIVF